METLMETLRAIYRALSNLFISNKNMPPVDTKSLDKNKGNI